MSLLGHESQRKVLSQIEQTCSEGQQFGNAGIGGWHVSSPANRTKTEPTQNGGQQSLRRPQRQCRGGMLGLV